MDAVKKVFLILFLIVLVGGGVSLYKYWRKLDDAGQLTQLFEQIMPNLATIPKDETLADMSQPRGGNISAIVLDYKEAAKAEEEARRTGKPLKRNEVKAVATPGPDDRLLMEWSTGRKMVALTYDDGPNKIYTPQLLTILREKNAKATFFVVGNSIKGNENLLQEIDREGHEIGSHSWSHKQLSKLKKETMIAEIEKGITAITDATGRRPRLVRPPYGAQNQTTRDYAKEQNLYLINWSVDTNDWQKKTTVETVVAEVDKSAYDGCIILMHDRLDKTITATGQIIDILKSKGYRCVTVSQLLGLEDPDAPRPTPTPIPTPPTITLPQPETTPQTITLPQPGTMQQTTLPPPGIGVPVPPEAITTITATPVSTPTPKHIGTTQLPLPQIPGVPQQTTQTETPIFESAVPDLPPDVITVQPR